MHRYDQLIRDKGSSPAPSLKYLTKKRHSFPPFDYRSQISISFIHLLNVIHLSCTSVDQIVLRVLKQTIVRAKNVWCILSNFLGFVSYTSSQTMLASPTCIQVSDMELLLSLCLVVSKMIGGDDAYCCCCTLQCCS